MNRDELLFGAWLSSLNTRLGRYAVRLVDEASMPGHTDYSEALPEVERKLATDLIELAHAILRKSDGLPYPKQDVRQREVAREANRCGRRAVEP